MHAKLLIFVFAVYLQYEAVLGQQGWMPQQAGQDPFSWFKPYYQTAWETSGKFYKDAMKLASQFYQPGSNGNAWGNGRGSMSGGRPGGMSGGMSGGMPGGMSGGMSGGMPGGMSGFMPGGMSGFMPF